MNMDQPVANNNQQELVSFLRTLWRSKIMIIALTLSFTLLGYIIAKQLPEMYTAETMVMINGDKTNVIDIKSVVGGIGTDISAIRSEIEVIKSRKIVEKTINELNLTANPEFNETLPNPNHNWFQNLLHKLVGPSIKTSSVPESVAGVFLNA